MEPLYIGHIGSLEIVLYIEVILNSEVIVQLNLSIKDTLGPWKLCLRFFVFNMKLAIILSH